MENRTLRGGWLRSALRHVSVWGQGQWLSSWLRPVLKRDGRSRSQLHHLLVLGLAGCGLLGAGLAQAYDGTYTGAPLNLELPTEDTFDWGARTNRNFTVINSSYSSIEQALTDIAVATTAAGAPLVALQVWQSTASVSLDALNASTIALAGRSTVLEAWQSTSSVVIAQLIVASNTASARLVVLEAWQSTASINLAALNVASAEMSVSTQALSVSTQAIMTLLSYSPTTYVDVTGDDMTGSLRSSSSIYVTGGSTFTAILHPTAGVKTGNLWFNQGSVLSIGGDYEGFRLVPGSDGGGYMAMGFGNSVFTHASISNENFNIFTRRGMRSGYNTSGNTKTSNAGLVIEDSTGRSAILLGYALGAGRAWYNDSDSAGGLNWEDKGTYGASNGVGIIMALNTPGLAVYGNLTATKGLTVATATFTGAVTAVSSVTILGSGATTYSLLLSSGAWMKAGGMRMPDDTVFYSTSQFGGSAVNIFVATGNANGTAFTQLSQKNTFYFDSTVFTATPSTGLNAYVLGLNASSSTINRTIQRFTSGSGTYTPSSGVSQIIVHVTGGGCGGGGAANAGNANGGGGGAGSYQSWLITNPTTYSYSVSTGANGGGVGVQGSSATPTTFGSLTSGSCGMGQPGSAANLSGRPGDGGVPAGTITGGSIIFLSTGGTGYAGSTNGTDSDAIGGEGGASFHGGGGRGGGAPAADFTRICSSGTAPGSGGGGGAAVVGLSGCAGARGEIVVEEFYPAIGPTGATGATGPAGFTPITCFSSTTPTATTSVLGGPTYIAGSSCTLRNVPAGHFAIFDGGMQIGINGTGACYLYGSFDGGADVQIGFWDHTGAAFATLSPGAQWFGPLTAGDHTFIYRGGSGGNTCEFPQHDGSLKVSGTTALAPTP